MFGPQGRIYFLIIFFVLGSTTTISQYEEWQLSCQINFSDFSCFIIFHSEGSTGLRRGCFVLFCFSHTHGMWKFPGQELNLCYSSDPSHCSANAGSLTCCAIRDLQMKSFKRKSEYLYIRLSRFLHFIFACGLNLTKRNRNVIKHELNSFYPETYYPATSNNFNRMKHSHKWRSQQKISDSLQQSSSVEKLIPMYFSAMEKDPRPSFRIYSLNFACDYRP